MTEPDLPPLLQPKAHNEPSVFQVKNLLREARRQRQLTTRTVPDVCLLDPDGDVVRHLRAKGNGDPRRALAQLPLRTLLTTLGGRQIGIVPSAVGAPYAILVAAELTASGCSLLISISSAGAIVPL